MSRFATPAICLSWACLCRATTERSAGSAAQHPAAWAAIKCQDRLPAGAVPTAFRARRGAKKANIAGGPSMLTAMWHMLKDGTEWHDWALPTSHETVRAPKRPNLSIPAAAGSIGYQVTCCPGGMTQFHFSPSAYREGQDRGPAPADNSCEHGEKPRFSCACPADKVSGAALLVRAGNLQILFNSPCSLGGARSRKVRLRTSETNKPKAFASGLVIAARYAARLGTGRDVTVIHGGSAFARASVIAPSCSPLRTGSSLAHHAPSGSPLPSRIVHGHDLFAEPSSSPACGNAAYRSDTTVVAALAQVRGASLELLAVRTHGVPVSRPVGCTCPPAKSTRRDTNRAAAVGRRKARPIAARRSKVGFGRILLA
ncbi:hypothetical protein FQR65_LT20485 [Abscondita terminalis]|nr:hypothetical protein FQR65_LT20485 [Abscondita terminalis]